MKFFHWASVVTAVFSVFVSSCAQQPDLTSPDMNNALIKVTTMSSALEATVHGIDFVNVIIEGPHVARGIEDIGTAIQPIVTMGNQNQHKVFNDADAVSIVETLAAFVQTQQQLLAVIIEKRSLLLYFVTPIKASLVQLEVDVDEAISTILRMCPTRKSEIKGQQKSLDESIVMAVGIYSS